MFVLPANPPPASSAAPDHVERTHQSSVTLTPLDCPLFYCNPHRMHGASARRNSVSSRGAATTATATTTTTTAAAAAGSKGRTSPVKAAKAKAAAVKSDTQPKGCPSPQEEALQLNERKAAAVRVLGAWACRSR